MCILLPNGKCTCKHMKLLENNCEFQQSARNSPQFSTVSALVINKPPDYAGFAVLSDLRWTFPAHTSRAAVTALSFTTELHSSPLKIAALGHGVRLEYRCIDSPGLPAALYIYFSSVYMYINYCPCRFLE